MCLPTCALTLLILLIWARNSSQPIEQLRKVNGNSQRGVFHYKAHCLCNLAASIFPSKPRAQRWQLHKPASELLIKTLDCMKAIRMLVLHWLFDALSGTCVVAGHVAPQADTGACWWQIGMCPCSQSETQSQSLPPPSSAVPQGKCT